MHELDEQLQVLLERRVVLGYQGGALLGGDALVGIVEARQGTNGPRRQTRNGSSKGPGKPHPNLNTLRQGFPEHQHALDATILASELRGEGILPDILEIVCLF